MALLNQELIYQNSYTSFYLKGAVLNLLLLFASEKYFKLISHFYTSFTLTPPTPTHKNLTVCHIKSYMYIFLITALFNNALDFLK